MARPDSFWVGNTCERPWVNEWPGSFRAVSIRGFAVEFTGETRRDNFSIARISERICVMKKRTRLVLSILGAGALAALAWQQSGRDPASEFVAAGQKFLASLRQEQRAQATIPFEDQERLNWHYIPRERKGVPFKILTPPQHNAADSLLESSLSDEGLRKARAIRQLEDVLRAEGGGSIRDPDLYYVSIFGTPADKSEWGWRMEGHHLSLNFTLRNSHVVSTTPFFFGANPATVGEVHKKEHACWPPRRRWGARC